MKNILMNNDAHKSFSEIFTELLEKKGIGLDRLSSATNIPKRYLTAFQEGDFKNLPATPYVRGYLFKIGPILDVDGKLLWKIYQREDGLKSSGERDILPSNRFTIRSFNKTWFVLIAVSLLIVGYLAAHIDDVVGTPSIEVSLPESTVVVDEPFITLQGSVSSRDALTLNDETVLIDPDGSFEKEVLLEPGLNTLEFTATRFLGREARLLRQVFYQPQQLIKNEERNEEDL